MPSDARKLTDWLHRKTNPVREALTRSEHLVQINHAFREWLREPWSNAVRLVNVEGDQAVIHTTHAAAATLLRFRAPDVLVWLRQRYNPACLDIKIQVRPDT